MEKLVVIPTYNERENISKMISKVMSLEGGYHLLVVDDGSPDGTGAIVKERQAEFPDRLFLLERSGKLGLGTAYIEGFRWALARPYDAVFEMDCDFSHNPDDLLRLCLLYTSPSPRSAASYRRIGGRSGCRRRFAVFERSDGGELAYVAAVDVLLRLAVCADRDGDARLRCDGRIRRL